MAAITALTRISKRTALLYGNHPTRTPGYDRPLMVDDLQPGAENAIRTCLNVQPHERVTVITDREIRPIADALVAEISRVGASHRLWVLEDEAPRPLTDLPATIAADMELSQVS